jgi:hypothetical protein
VEDALRVLVLLKPDQMYFNLIANHIHTLNDFETLLSSKFQGHPLDQLAIFNVFHYFLVEQDPQGPGIFSAENFAALLRKYGISEMAPFLPPLKHKTVSTCMNELL